MNFESIYKEYRRYVWTICYRMLGNEPDTEDAVQETFLNAFTNIHLFDPERGKFKTWLGRIACNVSIDILRRKGRFTELKETSYEIDMDDLDLTGLQLCLSKLPDDQRLVLLLKRVLQHRWEDVAEMVGMTVDQVRFLEKKARDSMKKCLSKE